MTIAQSHAVVDSLVLDTIWVYGVDSDPSNVMKNDASHTDVLYKTDTKVNMSHIMRKPVFAICKQQRRRSACASAQSDPLLAIFKTLASLCS